MRRLSLVVVAGLCSTLVATGTAYAAPMDFALSRLGLAPGNGGCDRGDLHCPNEALFQRLMLQFGTSMALPSAQPAATLGVKGFYLGIDTTMTTIDNGHPQWTSGTQGSAGAEVNTDVSSVIVWNRVSVRKGLPFGLEVDASLAQASSTAAWLIGFGLKWAIVEGFRTELGRLPDVALRASLASAPGARDASVTTVTADLIASKPFVLQRAWTLTPMFVLQGVWLYADSDLVDLTPDVDAFARCHPYPGHQLPQPGELTGRSVGCSADSLDYENTVAFMRAQSFNLRMTLGAELRYRRLLTRASLGYDLLAPAIDEAVDNEDAYPPLSRQLSFNLGVGFAF